MSDERLDLLETASTETTKEVDMAKDWELAIEDLNATILEETPKLTDLVRQHYLDLGNRYIEIHEQAAASGEEKKLRSWMRREMKKSFVSDIKIGHKLLEWERSLDRQKETETALQTIFSEVGLKVGFGLLEKLPDTYSKPNVRATDTERRKQVAIAILDELVSDVTVANETDPKNDLVPARIGNLVKTFSLPEVGDRVEFDKTMRGVVVEHVDGDEAVLDGAIVRIDNSGEEKLVLRGQKKFVGEPIARLHEAAIVRGDNPEMYGHTVVVQNYEPGDSELVEVLCLDGTTEKIPAKDLVRAKPKDAKVVGDLLHLVSEKGHLDKIKVAVEHAEKPLLKQIDELRTTAEISYKDGQIFAASSLSEAEPEVFVGAFTAMPSEKQAIVLSQIVPAKPAPSPLDSDLVIEIQGGRSDDEIREGLVAKFTGGEYDQSVSTPELESESAQQTSITESQPEPPAPEAVEAPTIEVQLDAVAEEVSVEVTQPIADLEPELDDELIKKAEDVLKVAFDTYRANDKLAKARKNNEPLPESPIATFQNAIASNPEVKTFLAHSTGVHFLAVISSEPWGAIGSYIKSHWLDLDTEAICDRIQSASAEVYKVADLYRIGDVEAIKPLDRRLKVAAQYGCLSKEERVAISKNGKVVAEKVETKTEEKAKVKAKSKTEKQVQKVEAKPVEVNQPNIELIRSYLLTSSHCGIAFKQIEDHNLSLKDVISCDELQAFCDKGESQSQHVEVILQRLDEPNYLTF